MAGNANSKPCQASEMELFTQAVTGFKSEFRILTNIWNGAFCKNSQKLKAVHYFCKDPYLVCLTKFWIYSELAFKFKNVSFLNQFKYQR